MYVLVSILFLSLGLVLIAFSGSLCKAVTNPRSESNKNSSKLFLGIVILVGAFFLLVSILALYLLLSGQITLPLIKG